MSALKPVHVINWICFYPAITQALYVSPTDCYNIHWPMVRGQLNVHSGPGGSLTAVLADLETIWGHVIQKQLDIPLKDLKVEETPISLSVICGSVQT